VTSVAHVGRTIAARVRTALEARDPMCVVPGCDIRLGLEIDHIVPFAGGGLSMLANLARLCSFIT
jgi:5-methylcytosine-specific restriction endonuclease McrA